MTGLTLGTVAAATGAALGGGADPARPVRGLAIDSRKARDGNLFAALRGEHVDGHDYAASAVAAGAVAVLASRPVPAPHLLVADVTAAMAGVASAYRSELAGLRVVGVTGSAGKTTTKDLLGDVLGRLGNTVVAPGSYNTDLGVPVTILAADEATRYLVLELGARAGGDIARLAAVGRPHAGVVLNIGSAHLGEFGSRAAIASAKSELVSAATEYAVLNVDDPLVAAMREQARGQVLTTSALGRPEADVAAEGTGTDRDGCAGFVLRYRDERRPVQLRLVGVHQVGNALAAAAVGLREGLDADQVAAALSGAPPRSAWRMAVTETAGGVLVVNDAYNANPESVRAALDTLATLASSRGGRPVAVLGEMLELGAGAPEEHAAVGRYAASSGVRLLVTVGEAARAVSDAAVAHSSWEGEPVWVPDTDAALELLARRLGPGDVVLVKASRAAGLERVAEQLLRRGAAA